MKLLLCVSSLDDITATLNHFSVTATPHPTLKFIQGCKILHHEVTLLETGAGVFQTTYKLTKALALEKYHLALKIGYGNAYKPETVIGSILNIVNDKPGDYGAHTGDDWKDLYDMGLLKPDDIPQQRGGFINLTNAYLNVFLPIKKVVGVTVNQYSDGKNYELKRDKYKADCETTDGLGFVYTCLYEKQGFYQLCTIERNLATGEENKPLANEKLNQTLIDLLQKL